MSRSFRIAPQWTISLRQLAVLAAGLAVAGMFALALKSEAQIVAKGPLIDWLPGYPVHQVSVWGYEIYIDPTFSRMDVFTSMALMWMSGVALVTAFVLRGWNAQSSRADRRFAIVAVAAGWLALDEALAIHESIGLNLGSLRGLPGIDHPDDAIMVLYGLGALAFGWSCRGLLRVSPGATKLFGLGVGLFLLAVVSDALPTEAFAQAEELLELAAGACLAAGLLVLGAAHIFHALRETARLERAAAASPSGALAGDDGVVPAKRFQRRSGDVRAFQEPVAGSKSE